MFSRVREQLDYKTKHEEALQQIDYLQQTVNSAALQIARLTQERDALQAQVQKSSKDAIAQAERLARALHERDAALQPKPTRATRGIIRGPYHNGAKPPLVE